MAFYNLEHLLTIICMLDIEKQAKALHPNYTIFATEDSSATNDIRLCARQTVRRC